MKKLLCVILALVMILMCACNGKTKDPDTDKEKDTEKKEEVTTAPETEKPAPPTFFEENGFEIETEVVAPPTFGSYMGLRNTGTCLTPFATSIGSRRIAGDYANTFSRTYSANYNIVKYYGEGQNISTIEVPVTIRVGESKLFGKDDFINLAILYKTIEDPEFIVSDSFNLGSPENINAINTLANELEKEFSGYKIVSAITEFSWGKIDDISLMQELGGIHATIGFELFDKYTGTVFSPGESGKLEDQILSINGESYDITVLSAVGAWLGQNGNGQGTDDLYTATSITAIVPLDYDGAVFALSDGDMKEQTKPEGMYNFKDSYLYEKENLKYYGTISLGQDLQSETLMKSICSQKMPPKDKNISTTFKDIYSLDFKGIGCHLANYNSTIAMKVDYTKSGNIYFVNNSQYTVSLFISNHGDNFDIVAQSGSIAPGEALYEAKLQGSDESNHQYGVVYYNADGSVAYIEILPCYYEVPPVGA